MALELNDLLTEDSEQQIITNGEAAILAKLETLQDQLDELVEKVNNLNLYENDGLRIDRY